MTAPLGRIVIYTSKVDDMVAFYTQHFGFRALQLNGDRIIELIPDGPGAHIMLHPTGDQRKMGQTLVKLVFDVPDVAAFAAAAKAGGLEFGPTHKADGYVFANAKDPSKNSIQISSRAFAAR